jgi:hypothetical protein
MPIIYSKSDYENDKDAFLEPPEPEPKWQLTSEIISRSISDNWHEARLEWRLADVFYSEIAGKCLCGHQPINEHCIIENSETGRGSLLKGDDRETTWTQPIDEKRCVYPYRCTG